MKKSSASSTATKTIWQTSKQWLQKLAFGATAITILAACNNSDKTPDAEPAQIRVVHASADAPNVDVLVGNNTIATNAPFGAATAFANAPSGATTIKVNAAGTQTSVINTPFTLEPKKLYTVIAADRLAKIGPVVITEDATAPTAGNIKIRVVHASPVAGNVDVYVTTPTADIATTAATLSNVPFKTVSDVLSIAGGNYRIRLTGAGSKVAVFDSGSVTLATGSDLVAIAVDRATGPSPVSLLVLTRTPATPVLGVVDNRAEVRVLHASPDAPNVDVLVNDAKALSNVPFSTASAYLPLPAGAQNFKVNVAGTATTAFQATPTLAPATSYSVIAINFVANIAPLLVEDKLAFTPPDKALIRVIHASPDAPNVDVLANGANVLTNVPYKTVSNYLSVTPGSTTFAINVTGTPNKAADATVNLVGGKVYTAVAVGSVASTATNKIKLILLTDR